jgi:tetratricopeptide (TPR) repeat protein
MQNFRENSTDAMTRAHQLAQSGDLSGAAQLCRAIVAREPSHFYALFMLGTIEGQFRQFDQAAEHLGRAVRIDPRSPEALTSYGNVLLEQKRHDDAIDALGKAIRLQPGNLNALIYRGLALAESGRNEAALKDFDRALLLDPQSVFALHNRANVLIALGRHKDARISVETLLKLAPGYVPALANYAILLTSEKKHREALAVLDRALGIEAGNPELINARGHALLALKRYEEALACYDRCALLKPDSASFQISRGNLFAELGRHDLALAAYENSIALSPDSPEAHLNRANMLMEHNRLDEAQRACERSIALKPDYAPALVLKGNLLLHQGRPDDAIAAYDKAVAERPDYAEGIYHRGSALLLRGNFKRGWRDFERRWEVADCGFDRPVLQAREWRGEKLGGHSIVVYSEQGMGDAIQFARFLPRLAAMGAKVTFLCHPGLLRLFHPFAADMEVTDFCEAERRFDFQCALMSLPERFGITLGDLPGAVPYVFAESAAVEQWRTRVGDRGFRIGICWQGNPLGKIDKGRSIPLAKYQPLGAVAGVRLISLQKKHGLDQLAHLPAGMTVETLGAFDEGKDAFVDTAAIMQSLDLVVTSDTAAAHLAGALGRSTWVALKHIPDWRFMLERGDSPWYPTMRLFRQPKREDWDSVFAAMAEALGTLTRASAGRDSSNIGS